MFEDGDIKIGKIHIEKADIRDHKVTPNTHKPFISLLNVVSTILAAIGGLALAVYVFYERMSAENLLNQPIYTAMTVGFLGWCALIWGLRQKVVKHEFIFNDGRKLTLYE